MNKTFIAITLVTLVLLSYGLYQGMEGAPTEQTMGDVQRIFYYHVPSAWVGFLCFFVNFIASIVFLMKRSARADAVALSTAEVGVVFFTIVLITGPLWAKPVWGIWWTWDARLTTSLVLWLIYVSYLVLRRFSTGQTSTLAAVLSIFGFLDVPIVYMSIRWWRTQHPQPVIAGGEGSGLHPDMWYALLVNVVAFTLFGALLCWMRYRLELAQHAVEEAHAMRSLETRAGEIR